MGKRFISKQNSVELKGGKIFKSFLNIDKYKNEVWIYEVLENSRISIPKILDSDGKMTVCFEYIQGNNVLELFEEAENKKDLKKAYALAQAVAEWMLGFYKEVAQRTGAQWILGDIHLRNFIMEGNGEIYGIDFEDARIGRIEEDIARLCAFILTYDPAFTEFKKNVSRHFREYIIEKTNQINQEAILDNSLIEEQLQKEIVEIERRRGKKYEYT